ncbi:TRPV6 [Scenedesmus sp. PABB004]|nr:TRPV6 [Scenedesmus sp. PABB004]
MITKLFPNQCNVYARGPVGENVMHVAMLLNTPSTLAITRYLVKLYGTQLVNCPIQERNAPHDPPGTYEGQTALHIAVVNRDFDMVKFLVQAGADIRARAWGTFFAPGGSMYCGEFPLSFAAVTGQKDVVAYLKRHGAQVNADVDALGNTALHLCVIHGQPDMYDFLVDYCAASDAVRNTAGLTPIVLAGQLGRTAMFQHIYSRRRRAFYSFGRVTSYSLALREIDTVQDEDDGAAPGGDGGYVPNVLEAVLRKRHLHMLQEPLLTTLLQHKWEAFARYQFVAHFLGYLLLEVSQTLLIWMHSDKALWNGPARASQEFVGVILALALLGVEVMDYVNWSREAYHRRLTMTVHKATDPPLYPIPGEMRDARDGRQSLFARLSARMGFAQPGASTSSSTSPGSALLGARSDGGYARGRSTSDSGVGSPPRGVSYPGAPGGGHNKRLSLELPASADASMHRRSHDDPIDLRPGMGGQVIGEGRGAEGVAVVDSGFTADPPTPLQRGGGSGSVTEGENAGVARVSTSLLATARSGPGPLGEAREEGPAAPDGADGGGAPAPSRASRPSGGGDASGPLPPPGGQGGGEEDDEGALDVVSVGLRSSRMRSSLAEPGSSPALAAAGDAATPAAAGGGRTVTFSDAPRMVRSASGRSLAAASAAAAAAASSAGAAGDSGSPRASGALGDRRGAPSPFAHGPVAALSTEGSGPGGAPPGFGTPGARPRLHAASTPLLGDAGSIDALGAAASPARPTPGGMPRARSFQGVASMASSTDGSAHGGSFHGGSLAFAALARAATAGDIVGTGSSPTDPLHAVQMLERQRTRARSGGGDLPAAHALKRTPAPSSLSGGRAPGAAAADGSGGGGGAGSGSGGAPGAPGGPGGPAGGGGGGGDRGDGASSVGAGDAFGAKADLERGGTALDPHKTRLCALLETTYEGMVRMVEDPWLFVWHLHLLLTLLHFIIWVASYGFVGGRGPHDIGVAELDDVVVSMMGLSGWLAVIYFFRGLRSTGKLAVVLERCITDVLKFVSLYVLWNLGFTLAFYTMQNGTLDVVSGIVRDTEGLLKLSQNEPDPFSSIGLTMVTLVNLGTGLSHYEYALTCKNSYTLSAVLCTLYYLIYMATVVLLLLNLLTAMIINTWVTTQAAAEEHWRHRWAIYVVKAERRLPAGLVRRLRLGTRTWDPAARKPLYSHVFETVDDDPGGSGTSGAASGSGGAGGAGAGAGAGGDAGGRRGALDGQIRSLEALLEDLRRRRGS